MPVNFDGKNLRICRSVGHPTGNRLCIRQRSYASGKEKPSNGAEPQFDGGLAGT
jgi:hypothetical protein